MGLALAIHLLGDLSEHWLTHSSQAAARVSHEITRGRFSRLFWLNIVLGAIVPLLICLLAPPLWLPLAAVLAAGGTYVSQHLLVFAGQQLPLS